MKNTVVAISLLIALVASSAAVPVANVIANGGFGTSNVAAGSYKYAADGVMASPWSFTGASGTATNDSAWSGTAFDGQWLSREVTKAINPSIVGEDGELSGWTAYSFKVNTVAAGDYTLTFGGLGSFDNYGKTRDTSVLLDNISVAAPVPEIYAMLLAGLCMMMTIVRRRKSTRA